MAHLKPALVALGVAYMLSAIAANTALADWYVAGTKLAAGSKVALAGTASISAAATISIPTLGFTVTCSSKSVAAKEAEIVGPDAIKTQGLTFAGCADNVCPIEPTVATQPLTGLVAKNSKSEDRLVFSPQTKSVFLGVRFKELTGCQLEGVEWPFLGRVTFGVPSSISEEMQAQPLQPLGTVENNSLEIAGDKAYIGGGELLLALVSRSKWSFH
jgi:hypothetical protein